MLPFMVDLLLSAPLLFNLLLWLLAENIHVKAQNIASVFNKKLAISSFWRRSISHRMIAIH